MTGIRNMAEIQILLTQENTKVREYMEKFIGGERFTGFQGLNLGFISPTPMTQKQKHEAKNRIFITT